MKEIIQNLFIGSQVDWENYIFDKNCWSCVLAAKEPWHRLALGYTSRAANKDHPEYLIAKRDNNLILNMVDANSSLFFDKGMVDTALEFIDEELENGKRVFIACNKGESRSASLGLLHLIKHGFIQGETLSDCEVEFLRLYPNYNPGKGMRDFVKEYFEEYAK